jgi:hypothetical protein
MSIRTIEGKVVDVGPEIHSHSKTPTALKNSLIIHEENTKEMNV